MKKIALVSTAVVIALASLSCTEQKTVEKKAVATATKVAEAVVPGPLRGNSMFDPNLIPKAVVYKAEGPGENSLLPRAYEGAPPQIPHDIEGFDIMVDGNTCLDCHDIDGDPESVPLVPLTHMSGESLNMARYQCNLCHVPQADVEPLVKNENDKFAKPKTGTKPAGSGTSG